MAKATKTAKKVSKKEVVDAGAPAQPVEGGEDCAHVAGATGVEGKAKRKKCGREIEVSVKVPGYVHRESAVVNVDKMDAADRASLLDQLIDQLVEQF